ncbi:hypothetical protein CGC53_03385 [Capnocytophaga leadbetteri]|uniref:Uncharacterized protein n=1 Tax=Capnocytophaga leadbetteri TaxID=327575 RepID=A0A250FBP4_9FLAO|nr:hypothetical protein CGC53_03385 [Capnocytophaga leadbetteri]
MYFCDKTIAYIVWKVLMIKYLKGSQNAGGILTNHFNFTLMTLQQHFAKDIPLRNLYLAPYNIN